MAVQLSRATAPEWALVTELRTLPSMGQPTIAMARRRRPIQAIPIQHLDVQQHRRARSPFNTPRHTVPLLRHHRALALPMQQLATVL